MAEVLLIADPRSLSPRLVGWDSVETAGLRETVLHIYPGGNALLPGPRVECSPPSPDLCWVLTRGMRGWGQAAPLLLCSGGWPGAGQEALGDGHGGNTWAFVLPPSLQGSPTPFLAWPLLSLFLSSFPTPQVKECPSDIYAGRVTLFDLCQWFLFKLSTLLPRGHASSFLSGPTDLAGVQGSYHRNGPPLPSDPASIL